MKDEVLKTAVAEFLKNVSGTAQHEIEKAVRNAVASGKLRGNEAWSAAITFSSQKVGLDVTIYGKIELSP
jgi:hypothetical protein